MERSEGVVGFRDVHQGQYLHLWPDDDRVLLFTTPEPPSAPYLLRSNGKIEEWQKTADGICGCMLIRHWKWLLHPRNRHAS